LFYPNEQEPLVLSLKQCVDDNLTGQLHGATIRGNYMNSRPPACSPQCVPSDRETTAWIRAANTKPLGEFYEQIIRAIYTAILQPGDLAIDCGANHGVHTIPMSDLVGSSSAAAWRRGR